MSIAPLGAGAVGAPAALSPGAPDGAFSAVPGTLIEAEVVQAGQVGQAATARLQNQVLLRLGDVLVAATLGGPAPAAGTRLPLIYLGSEGGLPRFLLAPQQAAAAVQSRLSAAGQLLGLLQLPEPGSGSGAAAASAAAPVWTDPPSMPGQGAAALAQALRSSGLFYESHLAAWAGGRLPLVEVLSEPQGQLSPRLQQPDAAVPQANPGPAANAATAEAARQVGTAPLPPQAPAAREVPPRPEVVATPPEAGAQPPLAGPARHAAIAAYAGVQAPTRSDSAPEALAAQLPAQLHGLVQQQLQALMQDRIVWQGTIWPGQTLRWSVQAEPDDAAPQHEAPEARRWTTALDLELPHLGSIRATLQLRGNRIDLALRRADAAGGVVDAALPTLRSALHTVGLNLGTVELAAPDSAPA